ncbi:uncharacterized protein LOC131953631 isoform X3 [Physella acuta]|nr:uncharacterized protein LOC131953631 isoform X3 [Physella acuta]
MSEGVDTTVARDFYADSKLPADKVRIFSNLNNQHQYFPANEPHFSDYKPGNVNRSGSRMYQRCTSEESRRPLQLQQAVFRNKSTCAASRDAGTQISPSPSTHVGPRLTHTMSTCISTQCPSMHDVLPNYPLHRQSTEHVQSKEAQVADDKTQQTEKRAPIEDAVYARSTVQPATQQAVSTIAPSPAMPNTLAPYLDGQMDQGQLNFDARLLACVQKLYHNGYIRNRKDKELISPAMAPPPFGYHIRRCSSSSETTVAEVESWPQERTIPSPVFKAQSGLYDNKNSLLDLENVQMFNKVDENVYPLVEKQTSNEIIKKRKTKSTGDKSRAKQLMIIKKMNRMRSADRSYDTSKDKLLKRRSKREKKTHGCHEVYPNKCPSTDNELQYDARKHSIHKRVRQRPVKCAKTKPGSKKYILYYYEPLGRTEKGEGESNKKQTTDRLAKRTKNKNSNENKSDNTKGNATKYYPSEQKVCHTCLSYKVGMKRRRSSKLIRNVRSHLSPSCQLNMNTNAGTADPDESKEAVDSASASLCSNEKYFSTQDIKVIDDSQSTTAACNEDTIDSVVQPSDGDGGHTAVGKTQNEGWEERKQNIMQACNEAIQSRLQRKDLEQIQSEECLESSNKETKLPSEIQPSQNVTSAINNECSQMEGASCNVSSLSTQKEDPSTAAMRRKKKTKTTEALYIKFESSLSKKVTTTVVKEGRKPLTDKYKLEHNPLHGSGELVKTVASDFESDKRNLLENPRHTRIIRTDKLDWVDKKTKHKSETSLGYLASKGHLESTGDKDGGGLKTCESEHRFDAVKDLLSAACKEDDGYQLSQDALPSSHETSTTISVYSPAQPLTEGGSIEPQPTYQVTEHSMENLDIKIERSSSLTSKERSVRRPKEKSETCINKKTAKKKKAQKVKKGEQEKVKDQSHTKTLLTISVTKKSPVRHHSPGAVKKRKVKDGEETSTVSPPKKEKGKKKKTGEKKRKKTKSENDLAQLSGSNISMATNEKWQHSSSAPLENLQMAMKTDATESPTEKSSSPKQERKVIKDEITLEIKSSTVSEVSKMSGKSSLEAIPTSSATSNDAQTKAEKAKLKKSEKELQKAELGWNSSLTAETKAADEKAKLIQRRNKLKYLIVKAKPTHDADQTKQRRPACRNNPADAESVYSSGSETEIKGEAASQREKAGQGKSVQFSESTENIESAKSTGGEGQSVDPGESIDEGEETNPNQESNEQSPEIEPANKPTRKPSGAIDKSDTAEEKVNVEPRSQSTPPRRKRPIWSKKTKEEQNRATVDKTNTTTRPMEAKLKLRHSSDNIKKNSRSNVHLHYPLKTNAASPKTSSLNSKNTISYNQMLNGVFVSAPVNKSAKKMIAKVGSPVDIKEIIEGTSVDAAEYGPKPRGPQETGVRPAKSVPAVNHGKVQGTDPGKKGKIGVVGLKKNKVSKVRESGSVRSLASMESADDYIRGTGKSGHPETQSSPTCSVSTDIDEVMKSKHGITGTRIGSHGHPRRKEKRPKKKSSSNHDVQWQPTGQVEPPRVHYYGDMMDLDVLNMGLSWMVQRFFNRLTVFQNNSTGTSDAGDMPSAQPVLE